MARYPERGKEFLSDLLEPAPPALSPGQVETVCRILIDMPDIGNWNRSALHILPRYRATAERLLLQDREGGDTEKQYRAQMWLAQLRGEAPGPVDQLSAARRNAAVRPLPDDNSGPSLHPPPAPDSGAAEPRRAAPTSAAPAYNGAMSGTLECTGGPVPQNAEYVFRNLPPLQLRLDYDARIWEARLAPGGNQSQRLILKNKSSGPQKRCVVHWSVVP